MAEMKALIPVMTSNTEPSGVVEYSSLWTFSGNYKGYHAFDNDDSTYWAASSQSPNEWLSYEFPIKVCVTEIFIDAGNEGSSGDTYKLQYYNGTDWVDLFEYRPYGNGVSERYSFNNKKYSNKYRVIFGGVSTHNTRMIQLYGTDDALVPIMTSNTTPKGECFGSGANQSASNYQFYHAFCGDNTKFWANDGNPTGYIGYDFGKPVRCYRFRFNPLTYHTAATITYKIQATNDINGVWTDVSELQTINTSSAVLYNGEYSVNAECDINPGNGYRYYRYKQESTNYGNSNAGAMQFYGTDETPHLKSSGSTEAIRDWLNASLYNKEEIDDLFIQNNQTGLIPYDLTVEGYEPEQYVKLVGQTSGKVYNLCLAALMGGLMINFSTEEQKTGMKWIDGKDVYQKTILSDTCPASGSTLISGVDELIASFGSQLYTGSGGNRWYSFPYDGGNVDGPRPEVYNTTNELKIYYASSNSITKVRWTFLYTKV